MVRSLFPETSAHSTFPPARRLVVMLMALALVATACGSGSSNQVEIADADADAASATEDEVDTAAPTTGAAASASDDDGDAAAPQTLDELLGTAALFVRGGGGRGGGGFGGVDTEAIEQEQQLIEVEVQRCMQAEGFTYTPESNTNVLRVFVAADRQGVSDEDYAATEGFGITTRFDAIFEGEIDLVDDEPSANDAHLETLSEGEREAWQFALRGEAPVRDEQGRLIDPDTGEPLPQGQRFAATGGCRADAQEIVRGDLTDLSELQDAFDVLEERIDADPRITEIRREWSACMLDAGFDYEDVAEARQYFNGEIRPLLRSFFQGSGLQAGQGGGQGGQLGALQALADQGLNDEQELQLQQLQDLEIATAVASLECAGDGDAEIAEITARYEAEFVETNRAALEAFATD